jgi:hypothetical protein
MSPNVNGQRELTADEQRFEAAHHLLEDLESHGVAFYLVEGEVRFRPASIISEAGKTELQHYKSEILELLREKAERAAAREARLAAQPEVDPMPNEEWVAICELTNGEQLVLCNWIAETLEAAPELERYRYDSYQLKHIFERARGVLHDGAAVSGCHVGGGVPRPALSGSAVRGCRGALLLHPRASRGARREARAGGGAAGVDEGCHNAQRREEARRSREGALASVRP